MYLYGCIFVFVSLHIYRCVFFSSKNGTATVGSGGLMDLSKVNLCISVIVFVFVFVYFAFVFVFVFVRRLKPNYYQLVGNVTSANGSSTDARGGEDLWLYFAIGGK